MKISVITVCKNSQNTIERTLQSVLNQTYQDIEYIVIDGNSTDNTLRIIERYISDINIFVSEEDSGIYNAMNKALSYSTGNIINFLNSDDYYHDNKVIEDVVKKFKNNPQIDLLYGNIYITNGLRHELITYKNIQNRYFYKHTICHQALFISDKLFEEVGLYNEAYKIHADTDWLLRAYFKHKESFKYYNRSICFFSSSGFCSNPVNAEKLKFDRQEISAKYFWKAKIILAIKKICLQLKSYHNKGEPHLKNI